MKGEVKGIVLWQKDYREKDKLVKIFTENYGPLVFFVRGIRTQNSFLIPFIQPGSFATFIGDFRKEGLSFLNDAKNLAPQTKISTDFSIHAHVVYILQLIEHVLEEKEPDLSLFNFTHTFLKWYEEGVDREVLTNIIEIQLLERFGVSIDFSKCVKCGEEEGHFDFSFIDHGLICQKHFATTKNRMHLSTQAIGLIRLFQAIPYDKIGKINVKPENKRQIRLFLDELYQHYVGVSCKGKIFLDKMEKLAFR